MVTLLSSRGRVWGGVSVGVAVCAFAASAHAGPAVPSGAHPRLFMGAQNLAGFTKNAAVKGTAAAGLVAACQDTIDNPSDYSTRGGSDGNTWPGAAVDCAFAYQATQKATYLTQALMYWQASLDDDQKLGDKLGCVAGVATDWQSWDGNPPAPPIILTVTHDTGYPMRWYGPDIALAYDWLYSAPGVTAALLAQTRTCLTAWNDYYTMSGYHNDQAGANYNAGYVIGKTLSAIAIGTDGGADGHLWNETVTALFPTILVGKGLLGAGTPVDMAGAPAGAMVGGDWLEGWEYGPLSVLEYAVATRALEENGAPQPDMDTWASSLVVRYVYGTLPTMDGQWVGGDFDSTDPYQAPSVNEVDAVLAGPTSDQAAAWAAFHKQAQSLDAGTYFYNALAELRAVTPADYRAQMPAPSPWYLSRGSRGMYVRTGWDAAAFWGVFSSAPQIVSDHEHHAAGNFVWSRGADPLVVDPSNYGEPATPETNAVAVDADLPGDYGPSQTPWSTAELTWARGTADAVFAARSDFAHAFDFDGNPSTIPYAHREWVMLPEGELVTIDRVQTKDAAHFAYVNFHANTAGTLKEAGGVALGTAGSSQLAIHGVFLSGGTPAITQPPVGDCTVSCNDACGACFSARFPVDEYSVKVPGPWAVAVHVFDGLAAAEAQATVGSLNDDVTDPAPKQNAGVLGAAVFRGMKQSYVVASSAVAGAAGATMTYGVPGGSPARHVVFDAPEDANGKSLVSAAVQGTRCVITITAGAGFAGQPLLFEVSSAADGCKATESTDVASGMPPPGTGGSGSTTSGPGAGGGAGTGGAGAGGGSSGGGGGTSGCKCETAGGTGGSMAGLGLLMGLAAVAGRRRGGRERYPAR